MKEMQHTDGTKTNSSQLDEKFAKFEKLKEISVSRVGDRKRFEHIKSELLSIRDSYNLTPTVLKDILTISLIEDEFLRILKKD